MAPQKQSVHFEGLNLLRFVAAMMILVFHAVEGTVPDSPLKMFVHNFPIGIDFFFIISGFLITYLLLQEKSSNEKISIGAFYLRRMLRIFPLYYLIILVNFIVFNSETSIHFNYTSQLFFWGNFETIKEGKWIEGFLSPLWTLCVEEHFYWTVPLLIALLPIKGIKYLYVIVMLLSGASKAYFTLHTADNFFIINCHTLSKMDVIAMGGLLACIYHERPFKLRYSSLYLISILIVMILIMATTNLFDYTTLYSALFIKYLINIPFIIFFCLFIFNENEVVMKFKNNRMLHYLGSISFGIYMVHFLVIFFLQKIIPDETSFQKIIFVLLTTIISVGIAALSFQYFETPFLRMKRKFEKVKTE